jgi:hypothetical protein
VSLQGSLETFALPDVLVLLASTKKNGELRVVGGKVDGRIWVEKGQMVHSEVNGHETASVDAVFELLRLDAGSFSFDADTDAPSRHEPDTVDLILADAQVRLGEWQEIARVVPHLDVLVDMAMTAPSNEVIVTAADWALLRSVAGGCTVGDLMRKLDVGEFETCKTVKRLVDEQFVSVDTSGKARPTTAAAATAAPAPARAAKDEVPPSVKVAPARRHDDEGADAPSAAAKKAGADAATEAEAELERLAEAAAARPRANGTSKVRAMTNTPDRAPAPTAKDDADDADGDHGDDDKGPGDEAKALVAQLAALGGENEEKIAKKVEEHLARGGELPEVPEGDEPINRGLLLKFLSSVRN